MSNKVKLNEGQYSHRFSPTIFSLANIRKPQGAFFLNLVRPNIFVAVELFFVMLCQLRKTPLELLDSFF